MGVGRVEGGKRVGLPGTAIGHGQSVARIPVPPGEFPSWPGSEGPCTVSWCAGQPRSCGLSDSCEPLTVHRMSER